MTWRRLTAYAATCVNISVVVAGCESESQTIDYATLHADPVPTWETFKTNAAYRVPNGEVHYRVEGDIGVDVNYLRQYYDNKYTNDVKKSTVVQSAGIDQVWNSTEKVAITYCVSDTWGDQKPRALADMQRATSQWMSAANVVFIYVPTKDSTCSDGGTGVTLNVLPNSVGAGGVTTYPHGSGRHLLFDYSSSYGTYSWLGAWTHEVGHSLGLGHEQYSPPCNVTPTGNDANLTYRLINSYDVNSSLHYNGICGSVSTGQMDSLDSNGLRTLYGAPTSSVISTFPTEWALSDAAATL